MTQEKQSTMRHTCDHCGKQVVLDNPMKDYWQSDDLKPEGWYRAEAGIPGGNHWFRVDLCPECGPAVELAVRGPLSVRPLSETREALRSQ